MLCEFSLLFWQRSEWGCSCCCQSERIGTSLLNDPEARGGDGAAGGRGHGDGGSGIASKLFSGLAVVVGEGFNMKSRG